MKKRNRKTDGKGKNVTKLLVAMTGKASGAKAAEGDKPVFDYIASLPQPQRGIAERIHGLAAKTLPNLQRAVKWGMAYYGVGGGWCFSSGAFVGHVKLMFIRGTEIKPEPPVTPIGMGKSTRGVELKSVNELDEQQVASWMKQAAANPFFGGKNGNNDDDVISRWNGFSLRSVGSDKSASVGSIAETPGSRANRNVTEIGAPS